jgi:hypothetical protein
MLDIYPALPRVKPWSPLVDSCSIRRGLSKGGVEVRRVELRDVDVGNWRAVVRVEPREDRRRFVASVDYHLGLCHYDEVWQPLILYRDD